MNDPSREETETIGEPTNINERLRSNVVAEFPDDNESELYSCTSTMYSRIK